MVYFEEVWVAFQNQQHRNSVQGTIQARIDGYPVGTISPLVPVVCVPVEAAYKGWVNALHVYLGFADGAFRDSEWTATLSALGTGAQGPVAKSLAFRWDHDETGQLPDANYQRIDL